MSLGAFVVFATFLLEDHNLLTTTMIYHGRRNFRLAHHRTVGLLIPGSQHRIDLDGLTGFQLKITQEAITLVVFIVFAVLYLKEPFHWKYLVSFVLILGAVYFLGFSLCCFSYQ